MARTLWTLVCLAVSATAFPVEEKFLPSFSAEGAGVAPALPEGFVVDANPVIFSPSAPGKKVEISITKEVVNSGHVRPVHGGGGHTHTSAHGHHAGNVHAGAAQAAPAVLHLDSNSLLIDNETIAGVLQNLLAGNIQNVQAHGQPLAMPRGGKPVAVIFSSAMHVVDLGNLRPTQAPAEAVQARQKQNHTRHQATTNHTSIIQSLMSPLISLAHIGGHNGPVSAIPIATTSVAQPVQMQPVVVMMPMPQQFQTISAAPNFSSFNSPNQINQLLQNILNSRQHVMMNSADNHLSHLHGTHPAVAVHTNEAPVLTADKVPLSTVPHKKQVVLAVTKTKIV